MICSQMLAHMDMHRTMTAHMTSQLALFDHSSNVGGMADLAAHAAAVRTERRGSEHFQFGNSASAMVEGSLTESTATGFDTNNATEWSALDGILEDQVMIDLCRRCWLAPHHTHNAHSCSSSSKNNLWFESESNEKCTSLFLFGTRRECSEGNRAKVSPKSDGASR
jgi:hypothetical protein